MANNPFETRARELLLNPTDKAAYLRLMLKGDRSEYQVKCPGCNAWIETYESHTLSHARTCKALREETV